MRNEHDGLRDTALLVLRGTAGVIFAYHGWLKLDGGVSGFGGFLDSLGVPMSGLAAWVVTVLEFGGGVMLVAGLLARVVGGLLVLDMIGAIWLVKLDVGVIAQESLPPGSELDLSLAAICFGIALLGAGRWSMDHLIFGRRPRTPAAPPGPPPATANVPAQPPPTEPGASESSD